MTSGRAEDVQATPCIVRLIIPRCPPRSLNRLLRMHWARRRELMELWRQEVAVAAIQAGRPQLQAARLRFTLVYDRVPLPDVDNALAVVAKLCLDGLVNAGVLPDDGPEHVRCVELESLRVERGMGRVEICLVAEEDAGRAEAA